MKKQEIKKVLENNEGNEFVLYFTELEYDFIWDGQNTEERTFQVVSINEVVLTRDQIADLLDNYFVETFIWTGTIIEENDKEVYKPAFGGDCNTDGVPEMGVIEIDTGDLIWCDKLKEL